MLSLVILFAAALIPIKEIYGAPGLNLDDLLDIIEVQQNKLREKSDESTSSDSTSTSSESDKTLRGRPLLRYLQQSYNDKLGRKVTQNNRLSKLYTHLANLLENSQSRYLVNNKHDVDSYVDNKNTRQVNRLLQYLLSSQLNKKQQNVRDVVPKQHDEVDADTNLDEYSRIYIILNPEALESDQNRQKLSGLVSRLLTKSKSVTQRAQDSKDVRYKGFTLGGNVVQRRRRDSMEGAGGMGSMEDYRPKRQRYNNNYYGGGGGGAGGRTAIPYIRHRGDIYERDH